MEALRSKHQAADIIGMLARVAGLTPESEPLTPDELLPLFSWQKIPTNDITINIFQ
jgi:glutamyl-tRNA synthetase